MNAVVTLVADGEHASLSADIPQIRAVEVLRQFDYSLVVDIPVLGDTSGVNLQDVHTGLDSQRKALISTLYLPPLNTHIGVFAERKQNRVKLFRWVQ
jgi:hypothetical protein